MVDRVVRFPADLAAAFAFEARLPFGSAVIVGFAAGWCGAALQIYVGRLIFMPAGWPIDWRIFPADVYTSCNWNTRVQSRSCGRAIDRYDSLGSLPLFPFQQGTVTAAPTRSSMSWLGLRGGYRSLSLH